jgi:hypothetical protein
MYQFPKEPKKIRQRIRRYERGLRKEYEKFGFIHDGFGKRYLLGPLYMILGDTPGAIKSFEWFEKTFPDDIGEPFQYLCWTLALYRSGDLEAAARKLRQTMLSNLYLIPHLLGSEQEELSGMLPIQNRRIMLSTHRMKFLDYGMRRPCNG